jgi:flagellar capping protein FliD
MVSFIDNYTIDDGILDTQIATFTDQNKEIDDKIEDMERRLEFTRAALEASFIAMEEAQANIQQQSNALSGLSL